MRPKTAWDQFETKIRMTRNCASQSMASAISDACEFLQKDKSRHARHSRSKNGVASLAYVPGISIHMARFCRLNRDCRDKRGNDEMQ
jgi:hypothetical protein